MERHSFPHLVKSEHDIYWLFTKPGVFTCLWSELEKGSAMAALPLHHLTTLEPETTFSELHVWLDVNCPSWYLAHAQSPFSNYNAIAFFKLSFDERQQKRRDYQELLPNDSVGYLFADKKEAALAKMFYGAPAAKELFVFG